MKKFLSILTAAAMLVSMTACNSGDNSSVSGESTSDTSTSEADSSTSTSSDASTSSAVEEIPEVVYELGGELTPMMIINSVLNQGNQARLAKFFQQLILGQEVTVAYLGGSITQGSSAGGGLCYADLTTKWLQEKYPDAKINHVNAGIGATGSYIGIHRADRDVLQHDPDLVFVDFSVNDTSDRMKINKSAYEGLIRKLWSHESAPAIICLAMTQENGTSVQTEHNEIAVKYDIPMISYRNAILDVINKGYIAWTDISDDNIHPNVQGHAVLTQMITNYLQTVIDNIDSIDIAEPELAATGDSGIKYQNAELVCVGDERCSSIGMFKENTANFGNFGDSWMAKIKGGTEISGGLEFTVEAQNIGILYGKMVNYGGMLDVYVDGELKMTINCDFPNGWGNYVEFQEVAAFMERGEHTVKIVPQQSEEIGLYYISALTLS
ncbi:MAG: SGNH/GDSL hydrolase family protein [Ruminococcaceae bacterium]|nr:SGNH/GDSL hydrolase family protein [Oscillospiraceae bacterium]